MATAVIVTGSRIWSDRKTLWEVLGSLPDGSYVIHGANPNGADELASQYCETTSRIIIELPFPADWESFGKSAGPKRNILMRDVLLAFKENGFKILVLAFPLPGSKGTVHMMEIAEEAGIEVSVFEPNC
jgi:hypothetical protein